MVLVVTAVSPRAAAQTWIEFRPEGIGYSVEMPGKWVEKAEDVQSGLGPSRLHLASTSFGGRSFNTMYSTYSGGAVRTRTVPLILDDARDGGVANVKGKLRSEINLTLNGHPGRQIVVDTPDSFVVISRFVMFGNTLIQAIVAGKGKVESEPATTRFLDSLKILTP